MLSDDLPDLRTLDLLATIARTRSISLAADELAISQQAASMRLRRLEQRLDSQLVVRGSRASELTPAGTRLLELAVPVLQAAQSLDRSLTNFAAMDRSVRVASSMTIAEYFLPRWISVFVQQGHDARDVHAITTNTRDVIRLVSEGAVDLGFVEGEEPPRGLSYRFLADDELGVYVSPRHPWARRASISTWTLAQTPLATREAGSGCRAVMRSALRSHGVTDEAFAAPAVELSNNTAVLESAAADVAPAVISTLPAKRYVEERRLVRVAVEGTSFRRQLGAVWKQGAEPAITAARALLDAAGRVG
ncbi:MAG: LysR family transcriptional regulator [Microbacterium sp.]|nr:LysR family transcriptional regulator [Microbacterium sp.]